mmetsp:Transcript_49609/g.91546  ORF Transcript_49609/g.91546 Transcript_49609/m.91546 type:complete len:462 (-) Transcript_49609:83-1468(-)
MSSNGTEDEGAEAVAVTVAPAEPSATATNQEAAAEKSEEPAVDAQPSVPAEQPTKSTATASVGAKTPAKRQAGRSAGSLFTRSVEAIKRSGAANAKAAPALGRATSSKPAGVRAFQAAATSSAPKAAAAVTSGARKRPDVSAIRRQLAHGPLASRRPQSNNSNGILATQSNSGPAGVKLRRTEVVAVKRLLGLGGQSRPAAGKSLRNAPQLPAAKRPRLAAMALAPIMVKRQVNSDDEEMEGPKVPRPRIPVDRRSRNLMGNLLGHLESAHRDFRVKVEPGRWEPSPRPRRIATRGTQVKVADDEDEDDEEEDEDDREVQDVDEESGEVLDEAEELDQLQVRLEEHYETMKGFISTSAEPTIFYLPAKHNAATRKKLVETRSSIDLKIASIAANIRSHLEEDDDEDDDEEQSDQPDEAPARKMATNGGVDPLELFPQAGRNLPRQNMVQVAAAAAAASVHR